MVPDRILSSLTLNHALTYQKQVDKLLWIVYNILDVFEGPATIDAAIVVENTLIDILKAHGLYEEEV